MKAWDPEEDHIIMKMHAEEGPKWKLIVKNLPGRTVRLCVSAHAPSLLRRASRLLSTSHPRWPWQVSSVRNRWQRIEKGRKLREEGADLKNRCHACGQPKRGHICYAKLRGGPQVDLPAVPSSVPVGAGDGAIIPRAADDDHQAPSAPLQLQVPDGGPSSFDNGPGSAGSIAGRAHPPLRRTRSGSKLVPAEEREEKRARFDVDVAKATFASGSGSGVGMPSLNRSNTSFFKDLVASDLFSPTSRDLLAGFADSPRDAPQRCVPCLHIVGPAAPPSLRARAGSQTGAPPHLAPPRQLAKHRG